MHGGIKLIATSLVDYGIHNEQSDLRAHVCVNAGIVYVFPTRNAIELVQQGRYRLRYASQNGVNGVTASGYAVPVEHIPRCTPLSVRKLIDSQSFSKKDNLSIRGQKAVNVVTVMLRYGWFPLPAAPEIVDGIELQREGLDIIVTGNWRIQVKCDYEGGLPKQRNPRITGNLFLQIAERNPLRSY